MKLPSTPTQRRMRPSVLAASLLALGLSGCFDGQADLQLPGMLNAAIRDCPIVGGKLRKFDAAAVMGMPGVKQVVPLGDTAVAVVATTWWRAKKAADALPIDWDEGPHAKLDSAQIAQMPHHLARAHQAVP